MISDDDVVLAYLCPIYTNVGTKNDVIVTVSSSVMSDWTDELGRKAAFLRLKI